MSARFAFGDQQREDMARQSSRTADLDTQLRGKLLAALHGADSLAWPFPLSGEEGEWGGHVLYVHARCRAVPRVSMYPSAGELMVPFSYRRHSPSTERPGRVPGSPNGVQVIATDGVPGVLQEERRGGVRVCPQPRETV